MTITEAVIKNIIRKLLLGQDYRIEIITLIDATFLQFAIDFFKRIVEAKLSGNNITPDWYKREMLSPALPKEEIAINAGLNMKTITNMYNSARREIVVDASAEHYDSLYQAITNLVDSDDTVNITLSIRFRAVSVELDINESLIVINTLAVKRSALRGGLWSTAGKQVEKPLLRTLCRIFDVPPERWEGITPPTSLREVDFYVSNPNQERFRCEVKLMGRGNPESADSVIARNTQIFVADKLSELNKTQLDSLQIEWVELRSRQGYRRFLQVLRRRGIPCNDFHGNIEDKLNEVLPLVFP